MRLRIKYSKTNEMRYISHLDVMRYFQKVLRRSEIDVCLSEGFSPHIIMSFALPLSVGMESTGEYFDVEVNSLPEGDIADLMNRNSHPDFKVMRVDVVPDNKANKCMTLTAAADYEITLNEAVIIPEDIEKTISDFLAQKEIIVVKRSKKGDKETDIRPGILYMEYKGNNAFAFRLKAGSVGHTNPLLAAGELLRAAGMNIDDADIHVCRRELYAETAEGLVPLFRAAV